MSELTPTAPLVSRPYKVIRGDTGGTAEFSRGNVSYDEFVAGVDGQNHSDQTQSLLHVQGAWNNHTDVGKVAVTNESGKKNLECHVKPSQDGHAELHVTNPGDGGVTSELVIPLPVAFNDDQHRYLLAPQAMGHGRQVHSVEVQRYSGEPRLLLGDDAKVTSVKLEVSHNGEKYPHEVLFTSDGKTILMG